MMVNFDQEKFDEFIINNDVIGFFDEPLELKSGRMSNWYVNWRTVTESTGLTDILAEHLRGFMEYAKLRPDTVYGVPEGATKLGLITQYKMWLSSPDDRPLSMGRGKPKEHGAAKDKYFLGMPKGKTVVIEDVTTTGGSLIKTIDQLMEADVEIMAAIGLTNRMELNDDGISVEQALKEKGVKYLSMSNAHSLLPKAYEKLGPGEKIAKHIEKEFQEYGVRPLKLL